jgi:hypothetical protein
MINRYHNELLIYEILAHDVHVRGHDEHHDELHVELCLQSGLPFILIEIF